jgi:hypothetical protein
MHGNFECYSAREAAHSATRLESLARVMDGAVAIPGTNVRLGLDALIGLVPVAGDMISGLISTYLIWEARQLGAPRWLVARMAANTLIDTAIGAIPIIGDAFDVIFRANMKNMALLRKYMEKRGLTPPGRPVIMGEAVHLP